jgi:hypothetical protein
MHFSNKWKIRVVLLVSVVSLLVAVIHLIGIDLKRGAVIEGQTLVVKPGKGIVGIIEIGMPIKKARRMIPDAVDPTNDRRYAKFLVQQSPSSRCPPKYRSAKLGLDIVSDKTGGAVRVITFNDGTRNWSPFQQTREFPGHLAYRDETNKVIGLSRTTAVRLFGEPLRTLTATNVWDMELFTTMGTDTGNDGISSSVVDGNSEILLYPLQGIGFLLYDGHVVLMRIEKPGSSAFHDGIFP